MQLANIHPIDRNPTGRYIVKARDEVYQGRFPGTGRAQNGHGLARFDDQVDTFQDGFITVAVVMKRNILEDNPSKGRLREHLCVRRIPDFGYGIQYLIDASCGGNAAGPGVRQHGHHRQRCHRRHQVIRKGNDLPYRHAAMDGL